MRGRTYAVRVLSEPDAAGVRECLAMWHHADEQRAREVGADMADDGLRVEVFDVTHEPPVLVATFEAGALVDGGAR